MLSIKEIPKKLVKIPILLKDKISGINSTEIFKILNKSCVIIPICDQLGSISGEKIIKNTKPWIEVAFKEELLGVVEFKGSTANPNIIKYHKTTGKFLSDEVPWCSSFINYCMIQAQIDGTNSAMALSWKKWGQDAVSPAYGSVAVIDWGRGTGHVGFVVGKQGGEIVLLGGNQTNSLKRSSFHPNKIIAYRYPKGYKIESDDYLLENAIVNQGSINGTR